jgi:hypothetical protein
MHPGWFAVVGGCAAVAVAWGTYMTVQPQTLDQWLTVAVGPVYIGLLTAVVALLAHRLPQVQQKERKRAIQAATSSVNRAVQDKLFDLLVSSPDAERSEWVRQLSISWANEHWQDRVILTDEALTTPHPAPGRTPQRRAEDVSAHATDPSASSRDLAQMATAAASAAAAAIVQQTPRLSAWVSLLWVVGIGGIIGGFGMWLLLTASDDLARGAGAGLAGAAAAFILRDVHDIARSR